jgi:hypothetical protein
MGRLMTLFGSTRLGKLLGFKSEEDAAAGKTGLSLLGRAKALVKRSAKENKVETKKVATDFMQEDASEEHAPTGGYLPQGANNEKADALEAYNTWPTVDEGFTQQAEKALEAYLKSKGSVTPNTVAASAINIEVDRGSIQETKEMLAKRRSSAKRANQELSLQQSSSADSRYNSDGKATGTMAEHRDGQAPTDESLHAADDSPIAASEASTAKVEAQLAGEETNSKPLPRLDSLKPVVQVAGPKIGGGPSK